MKYTVKNKDGELTYGSLEVVARSFADSQIRLEPLAPYFGTARLPTPERSFSVPLKA